MNIDDVVNKAIPIFDRDCHNTDGKKCEKDCRITVDWKKMQREALKKRIEALMNLAKAEGREESKRQYGDYFSY